MKEPNTGETTGVKRKLDELGRVVLPVEFRKELGVEARAEFEMFLLKDGIYLKKVEVNNNDV